VNSAESPQAGIGGLFRLEEDLTHSWRAGELTAILQHQLAAPPESDLRSFDVVTWDRLTSHLPPGGSLPQTYRELLQRSDLGSQWLDLTKRFAKAAAVDGRLPREIAAVLYLAAIGAALLHDHCRITDIDDESLKAKIAWAASQPWLDEEIRELLVFAGAS